MKKPLLLETFILAIVIAVLHLLALKFSLYWIVPWTDIVMHLLGGLWVALFGMYILFVMKIVHLPECHRPNMFLVTMGFVLLVGLGWELWELLSGLTFVLRDKVDTIIDLVMDILGGGLGFWYGVNKVCQKN